MGLFSRFERHMENGLEGAADKMFDAPISPVQISKKAEKAMRQEKMVGAGKQYAPTLYTVLVNPQDDQRLFGYYPTLAGETETYLAAKAQEEGLLLDGQPLVRFIVDDDLKRGKFDIIAEMVSAPIIKQLRAEEMARYGIGNSRPVGAAQNFEENNYRHVTGAHSPAAQQQAARDAQVAARNGRQQQSQAGQRQPRSAQRQSQAARRPIAHNPQVGSVPPVQAQPQAPQYTPAANRVNDIPSVRPDENELPYVPENEIDRSIDYGEYTFNSEDFVEGRNHARSENEPIYESAPSNRAYGSPAADQTQFIGSAAPRAARQTARPARLTNMSTNRIENLDPGTYTMGRGADADIAVSDINASRMHAQIQAQPDGSWLISDLDSTNGTKVNGQRVASQILQEGDRITIGLTNYLFTYRQ
ncbi:MAG: FhaA domain-containing protein [Eggerthellaceae bacterium]|jgi:hypothetical protein